MAGLIALALVAGVVSARRLLSENFIRPGTTKDAYLRGQLDRIGTRPAAIDVYIPRTGWSDFPRLGLLSQRSDVEGDLHGDSVVSSTITLMLGRRVPVALVPRPATTRADAVLIDMTPLQRALLAP
jgi:hypothetical protein